MQAVIFVFHYFNFQKADSLLTEKVSNIYSKLAKSSKHQVGEESSVWINTS